MAGLGRTAAALVAVGLLGLAAGCGGVNASTDAGPSVEEHGTGDTSPGQLIRVGEEASIPEKDRPAAPKQSLPDGPDESAEEKDEVRLQALEQPSEEFPKPKLPKEPAEDSDELTHIVYLLETSAWTAAGVVDEDTETDCAIDSSDLVQEGKYDFGCEVSFSSGASVDYDVVAEVKDKKVLTTLDTESLPVSEEKAVHEATRQSYKPARVTCDILDVETVRVGKHDGFTCWVTDVENNRTAYQGEILEDGQLALRQR